MGFLAIFISYCFASLNQLQNVENQIIELHREFSNPVELKDKKAKIFSLNDQQCAIELSQIVNKSIKESEQCQLRLWRVHFNFLKKLQLIKLKSELDLVLKDIKIDQLNHQQKKELRFTIKNLKSHWSDMVGEISP
ncbi:MAG: hypothetical protein OHK0056_31270 [Bacteriovoracaceae bacterium]